MSRVEVWWTESTILRLGVNSKQGQPYQCWSSERASAILLLSSHADISESLAKACSESAYARYNCSHKLQNAPESKTLLSVYSFAVNPHSL